ncbi:MAG: hypothetical protein AB1763_09265 [Campylobacterota bacterium]
MTLEPVADTYGVSHHPVKKRYHTYTRNDIVKSVVHSIILPLIIGIFASKIAGALYLVLAAIAYSTVFRDRSAYFWAIMKVTGAVMAVLLAYVGAILSLGAIGAMLSTGVFA